FPGRASGGPQQEGPGHAGPVARRRRGDDLPDQVIEMLGLPEEIRLVGRYGVYHVYELGLASLVREDEVYVLPERVEAEAPEPLLEPRFEHDALGVGHRHSRIHGSLGLSQGGLDSALPLHYEGESVDVEDEGDGTIAEYGRSR